MPDSNRWSGGGDPSLNEIARADRFFEALAAKQPAYPTDPAEAELAFLFSEFRDDVRDSPVTVPVSQADAVEALRAGQVRDRGSRRGLALVGSVAAAMLCIGGFGTAVYGAGPGDSLYGMHTALFGQQEQTRDDQVSLASAQLQQVQQLIDQGQWEQAQDKLVEVSSAVQGVDGVESKQQLVEQWNALTYKVVEQDPAATLAPGEPLPALPSSPLTWLPVPAVEATTTESTTTTSTTTDTTSPTSSETSPTSPTPPTTESSGAVVPPEVSGPPPSESPASPPPTTSTATSTTASSSAPTTTTTTTVAPSPSPTRAPASAPATATSTVPVKAPEAASPSAAAPAAEGPASQARPAPSASTAVPPAVSAPSSAPVAPSQPAASSAPAERPSAPVTTTVASPAS